MTDADFYQQMLADMNRAGWDAVREQRFWSARNILKLDPVSEINRLIRPAAIATDDPHDRFTVVRELFRGERERYRKNHWTACGIRLANLRLALLLARVLRMRASARLLEAAE